MHTHTKNKLHKNNEAKIGKKEEQIKNVLRKNQTEKFKITMIYISFKYLLTEERLDKAKVIFCDVIRCSIGLYNFTPQE